MSNSWKIGAISGLIAGIPAGIADIVHSIFVFKMGLPFWIEYPPITNLIVNEMAIWIIWGIFFGIIYSKIYGLICGRTISKGLVYGLGLYLIINIRNTTYFLAYGNVSEAISQLPIIFEAIVFGVVLGIIFELFRKRYSITEDKPIAIKQNLTGGIHPGAIAGLIGGTVVFITNITIFNRLLYEPEVFTDIGFMLGQWGSHALFNMVWGIIFGIFFVMFFGRIPGKGILKAVVFSLIIYFITSFRGAVYYLVYGFPVIFYYLAVAAFLMFLTFGIVLGLLYRKPSD